jgi:hypothetical protein
MRSEPLFELPGGGVFLGHLLISQVPALRSYICTVYVMIRLFFSSLSTFLKGLQPESLAFYMAFLY